MGKLNVCVIFGGNSSEHEVSRVSARNIINNLNKDKYNVYALGITKHGQWLLYEGPTENLDNGDWEKGSVHKVVFSTDAGEKALLVIKGNSFSKIKIDVAYLTLHGRNGEDGTVQGLLQLAGIPYTGPGVLSSALCMDKTMTKIVLAHAGVPQLSYLVFVQEDMKDYDAVLKRVSDKFTYPVFVKPSGAGSSLGANKVNCEEELIDKLNEAFNFDTKVMVEEYINAREVECGIIGNENPKIALLGEVINDSVFYDFDAKYTAGKSSAVIPANLTDEQTKDINDIARKAYLAMGCRGLSRIDFFVEKETGKVFLNELNTLPGCTDSSMFPILWQKSGVPFSDILDEVISYAFE